MHDLTPKQKRMARILALQVIYAQEFKGSEMDAIAERRAIIIGSRHR